MWQSSSAPLGWSNKTKRPRCRRFGCKCL
jgi:hypothetical protein